MNEILAFDWGTTIVGILDVHSEVYTAYRGRERMVEGAKRIVFAEGTVVSFNGAWRDLSELFDLLRMNGADRVIKATHDDILEITSNIRWPPDPGTRPINGPGLEATYRHYFNEGPPSSPPGLADAYEARNWLDCHMTAELWKKWKRGELAR